MGKPQLIVRELCVCEKCNGVGTFRTYKHRGRITYMRCKCGHHAVRRDVVKLRLIRDKN